VRSDILALSLAGVEAVAEVWKALLEGQSNKLVLNKQTRRENRIKKELFFIHSSIGLAFGARLARDKD